MLDAVKSRIARLFSPGHDFFPLFLLLLLGILIEVLVNPVGEFPVHDDWVYARTVHTLVTQGRYELCGYQTTTLFAQALWGALFVMAFGFSMTVLRFSVVLVGGLGILAAYRMFQEAGGKRWVAFLAALTLLTSPLYVLLSNTFMTDVPFVVLTVTAFLFLVRYLRYEKQRDLVLGIFVACVAGLVRQLAMVIPIAFSLAYLVQSRFKAKAFRVSLLACGIVGVTLFVHHRWLVAIGQLPVLYAIKSDIFSYVLKMATGPEAGVFIPKLCLAFSYHLLSVLIYQGIFLFPFMLTAVPWQWKNFSFKERLWGGAGALLYGVGAVLFLAALRRLMPLSLGMFYDLGLGDETSISGGRMLLPKAPLLFWQILTAIGVLGSGWLVFHIGIMMKRLILAIIRKKDVSDQWGSVLCFTAICVYFFPLGLAGHFDRYQLFYMPLFLFWMIQSNGGVLPKLSRFLFPVVVLLLAGICVFSSLATRDYLNRIRTRWGVLRHMMSAQKISPLEIDGGYEFNGWYTYDPNYRKKTGMNWWWVVDDKYRVSNGPVPEYRILHMEPYVNSMPPGKGYIYVLKRNAEKRPPDTGPFKTVYEF